MAYLSPETVLKIRGKIGDKIYKEINGKIFITKAPEKINSPNDAASVLRKERFAVCQKLSSAIKKLPSIHLLWKYYLHSKNVSTRIFQLVFAALKGISIEKVSLLPGYKFNADISSFSFSGAMITSIFKILSESSAIWPSVDVQMNLCGVIMLVYDEPAIKNKFEFIPVTSLGRKTELDKELQFEILLSPMQLESINKSLSTVMLMALVTSDTKGIPLKYSTTFYQVLK